MENIKCFLDHINNTFNDDHRNTIIDFFISFARFEGALKVANYLKPNQKRAEPNWDGFTNQIANVFDKNRTESVLIATEYLLMKPPKIQVVLDGQLMFECRNMEGWSDIKIICQSIRDIRNNLFHGSKFHGEISRNQDLMKNAMVILEELLYLCPDVRNNFIAEL